MQCTKEGALNTCTGNPSLCSESISANSDIQDRACHHQDWTRTVSQLGQRTFGQLRQTPLPGETLNAAMRSRATDIPYGSLAEATHPIRGGLMQPRMATRLGETQRNAYETLLACDTESRYKNAAELVQRFANRYDN
jgi:hypothetical protein